MAVFRYKAVKEGPEEYTERGIIVARDEARAKARLKKYGFSQARLKRLHGLRALWARLTADIR